MRLRLPIALALYLCFAANTKEPDHRSFREDFSGATLQYFRFASEGNRASFTRTFGGQSPTEPGSRVLSFKIDPADPAGAGRGPEIISNDFTHYGRYSARIKVPDVRKEQPNVGAVVGFSHTIWT